MRIAYSIVFAVLIAALVVCAIFAFRSKKEMSKYVGFLLLSLIPPVCGNLFIISSPKMLLSLSGCYIYYVGMDIVMFALIKFTIKYCDIKLPHFSLEYIPYVLLLADAIQLLVNIQTGHAFYIKLIEVEGAGFFYDMFPLVGQTVHRILDYSLIAIVMVVFLLKAIKTSRVYSEKYWVILLAMVVTTIWETIYIFSDNPIERSMVGFGVFGILVFLLALYYRPLRVLNSMLAEIASNMTESLFFYDANGKCIWMNNQAHKLVGIDSNDFDLATEKLVEKFGELPEEKEFNETVNSGQDDTFESYVIAKHLVTDSKNHQVGSFLVIRDNTAEQKNLQTQSFKASHDALTQIYNREGFNLAFQQIDLSKCFLLLFDLDSFKEINDNYGHEVGDKVLVKIVDIIKKHFREEDYVCRIGGDEFAVIIPNIEESIVNQMRERVRSINNKLLAISDGLPTTTTSVGGAYGKDAENEEELFNNADHAMYQTKFDGKCGYTLFKRR